MNSFGWLGIATLVLSVPTLTVQILILKKVITPNRALRYICFELMPWVLLNFTTALIIVGLYTIKT